MLVEAAAAIEQLAPAAQTTLLQYGVLGVGIIVFGGVIVFLFKQYQKQIKKNEEQAKEIGEERKTWAVEREQTKSAWAMERETTKREHAVEKERMSTEAEERHAALVLEYAHKIEEEHKICREREDAIREDYDAKTTVRSDEMRRAQDALTTMLEKLTDRLVFSRTTGGRH